MWLGYEPSDDTIAQAWAENVAVDPAQQITALPCSMPLHSGTAMWKCDIS